MTDTQGKRVSNHYATDYVVGQDNIQAFGFDLHNPVFFISELFIFAFVGTTLLMPEQAMTLLSGAKGWAIETFDWLFMASSNVFILFCLALALSPMGKIRLGGDEATPDFSGLSWAAMLFASGMGIGLMFWSVAEPIAYYSDWYGTPFNVEANTDTAADLALAATMYHWGLHAWAIYAVVGLSLAFFCFNKNLPLTLRSAFYPILGERTWGWAGHIIDTLAVLATLFGLATSLGLGAKQASAGLEFVFGLEDTIPLQISIIAGITLIAIASVARGLHGGVKVLSNVNMAIAALLFIFVLLAGPTLSLMGWVVNTGKSYAGYFFELSNWVGRDDEDWLHAWSVFYWAWWVAWSPFVGMFIARISRGRTVREFLGAVILIPTTVTLLWMGVFGGGALEQSQNGVGQLANGLDNIALSMFYLLEQLPWTDVISTFGIFLVLVFFITSSDSGSLVIDSITSGGKLDAPIPQRIFWAAIEGLIASVLLYIGGTQALDALQAGTIAAGLPFTLILLFICVNLYKGLQHERQLMAAVASQN
ncbi:BCCT family transporter [Spongiibacter nanhainus]|uniref:BCCT family transporter n=1 Tax=Spongiibacter nanhainus TaxID=2794344 RepID=A0A7T4UQZ3_9GAMM|nr:BCCT family transporter [Spongiibacter nanhainus]QQD19263.1 BCCT family transporter [Spongiibacter nanhainus]